MNELEQLPNIGKEIANQLKLAGIKTSEELKAVGSRQAWLNIKVFDPSACYNRLCGLEGAIQNVRWHNLSDEVKKDLKDFYNRFKK